MKKFTFLSSLILAVMLLFGAQTVSSQLLVEDFDYAIGSLLTAGGWTAHSGAGTASPDVVAGLTFDGYAGSNVGGAANLDATGEDVNKSFEPQTEGAVYVAFILKTSTPNFAGYFLHLGQSALGSTFISKVWVNGTGDGIGIGSGPTTYVPIVAASPVLVVVKYDITSKVSSLFALTSYSATEPAIADQTFTETGTYTNIGTIALRQYNAAQRQVVDGIRVAKTWAEAVAPSGAPVTKASSPAFTPGTGNYYTTQSVSLSSSTEGATIYYTVDGTDPDETKTMFSAPISVSATTTIKAKAYKAGLDPSNMTSATYTFPTEVANFAALRANTTGFYKYTGKAVLTLISTDATRGNPKYVQDATGAVMIHDPQGKITTTYQLGDGITNIYGTLSTYSGMLQFTPVADTGTPIFTGNPVTPLDVALADMINHPAKLVTINNVSITGEGSFVALTNYNLNGAANPVLRTAYSDLPYITYDIPSVPVKITGVVLVFNTTAQIVPRTINDFSPATALSMLDYGKFNVYVSGGSLQVDAEHAEKIEIFNVTGQEILRSQLNAGLNTFEVPNGILIVRIGDGVTKVVK